MTEFKDKFTLDGLVMPPKGVTKESVGKVAQIVAEAKRGSFIAEARLKESLMTGTLATSVAHFINVITIPQLPDDNVRPVAKLAGFRTVSDFRPAVLYSMFGSLKGPGITSDGAAPRVPQGTPYPEVTITGMESAYAKLAKRGNRINWDFEDFVNDTLGVLDGIPAEMRDVALETEWQEVGEGLVKATTAAGSVELPDGTTVATNAKISANAIMAAAQALAARTVNGEKKKIGTLSGYNVVVGTGKKIYVDYMIRQALGIMYILPVSTSGGSVTAPPDNSLLSTIEVIEHDKVTGDHWYLVPKPGAYRRPVLDVLRLRGYETPQIRVKSEGGDGFSFDADTAAMRLRLVTGAALWFQEAVVYSAGSAS